MCHKSYSAQNNPYTAFQIIMNIVFSVIKIRYDVFQLNAWMALCLSALWITKINL